jgi:hypothetical protein
VGEAQQRPAAAGKQVAPLAVLLERGAVVMEGPAVQLDCEAGRHPHRIHLDAIDVGVEVRTRDPMGIEESDEAIFEG